MEEPEGSFQTPPETSSVEGEATPKRVKRDQHPSPDGSPTGKESETKKSKTEIGPNLSSFPLDKKMRIF